MPRRDTKPLAKALLREFGSLAQLVNADPESLRRFDGLGDTGIAALKIVQASSLRLLKGEFRDKPLLSSWDALLDWLRADMGPLDVARSEEHTSELQSLMRISYAVFCLQKKKIQ